MLSRFSGLGREVLSACRGQPQAGHSRPHLPTRPARWQMHRRGGLGRVRRRYVASGSVHQEARDASRSADVRAFSVTWRSLAQRQGATPSIMRSENASGACGRRRWRCRGSSVVSQGRAIASSGRNIDLQASARVGPCRSTSSSSGKDSIKAARTRQHHAAVGLH